MREVAEDEDNHDFEEGPEKIFENVGNVGELWGFGLPHGGCFDDCEISGAEVTRDEESGKEAKERGKTRNGGDDRKDGAPEEHVFSAPAERVGQGLTHKIHGENDLGEGATT